MRRWLRRYVRESFGTFRLRLGWWRWLPLYASPLYHTSAWWRWYGLAVGAFGPRGLRVLGAAMNTLFWATCGLLFLALLLRSLRRP